MGIIHYESGKKLDIQYSSIKSYLLPVKQQTITTTASHYFEEIVPTGKQWDFIGATSSRSNSGVMYISIMDTTAHEVELGRINDVILHYQPTFKITISEGWRIRSYFFAGAFGAIKSMILVEEETKY